MKKIIYVMGKGFLQGLPARDMTIDEWEGHDKELRDLGLSLGMYKIDEAKKPIKTGEE